MIAFRWIYKKSLELWCQYFLWKQTRYTLRVNKIMIETLQERGMKNNDIADIMAIAIAEANLGDGTLNVGKYVAAVERQLDEPIFEKGSYY